jgi:3-hydroxyisobutyrate dehydrogenase-like beta-hydroxyacid dehydrogenase
MVIGIVHPGEMGAAIGALLARRGHEVLWASAGRTGETATRAQGAGLSDAGSVETLAGRVEAILSVCPPHAALDVARTVGSAAFKGLYLDANAVSPATAQAVGDVILSGRAPHVDGGSNGPPPGDAGSTRLYLSGAAASRVAEIFEGTELGPVVLAGEPGVASALKMAYAAWTKGSAALLLASLAAARAEGVEEALRGEWALSQPGLLGRAEVAAESAAKKGWRWVGEMEEIAATLAASDLPDGFHQAAAELFSRSGRDGTAAADARTLELVLGNLVPGARSEEMGGLQNE